MLPGNNATVLEALASTEGTRNCIQLIGESELDSDEGIVPAVGHGHGRTAARRFCRDPTPSAPSER